MKAKTQQRFYVAIVLAALLPTLVLFSWGITKAIESPEYKPRLFVPMQ